MLQTPEIWDLFWIGPRLIGGYCRTVADFGVGVSVGEPYFVCHLLTPHYERWRSSLGLSHTPTTRKFCLNGRKGADDG